MNRGRPRKLNPDDVLDIAMRTFWEKGYAGTSMNDLVKATGMAKPGLYANFGDKEKLYSKALGYYFHDLGKPLLDDLKDSPDTVYIVIRRFLDHIAHFVVDKTNPQGCFVVNSLVECTNKAEPLERLAREFDEERHNAFINRFILAKEKGEISKDANPQSMADFFSAQALALGVMGRSGQDYDALSRVIDVAMSVIQKD